MNLPVLCYLLFRATVTSGFVLGPGHGPMCHQCEIAINPNACMKTGRCLKDQECYTETYTASDSTQLYRLGCISAHICRISIQSTFNDTGCFSCCQTDNCNTNLCPSSTCRKPYYGPICTDVCGHCANHEQCDKETGRCLNGCDSGFVAPYCNSVCPRHSYGPNCRFICGKCAGEGMCDPQNGACIKGCEPSFIAPLCTEVIRDCADIKKKSNTTTSGIYQVNQKEVWCDMTTDGEGWIVFQRRTSDSVQFYRTWNEYKNGFGYINGSYWWGNENLASFTSSQMSVLRIDIEDAKGQRAYAEYQGFYVEHENEHFRLHLRNFHGNVSDSMSYLNGVEFSTKDQDNDNSLEHCAQVHQSGWWFSNCAKANPNGVYNTPWNRSQESGFAWFEEGTWNPLIWAEMKFRST